MSTDGQSSASRRRKRRWGDAAPQPGAAATAATVTATATAPSTTTAPAGEKSSANGPVDGKAKALALQASIRAKLAALKARTGGGGGGGGAAAAPKKTPPPAAAKSLPIPPPPPPSSSLKRPAPSSQPETVTSSASGKSNKKSRFAKRAKHYELDMSVTGPTFNKKPDPAKPKVNPYLAHLQTTTSSSAVKEESKEEFGKKKPSRFGKVNEGTALIDPTKNQSLKTTGEDNVNDDDALDEVIDERVVTSKQRQRHKSLKFVEPGTFIEIAERKRLKAANAEQSGFLSGRKAGMYIQSSDMMDSMANIYGTTQVLDDDVDAITPGTLPPRPEATEKTTIPYVLEWWDLELLPNKLKKQIAAHEGEIINKETQSKMNQLVSADKSTTGTKIEKQISNWTSDEVIQLQNQAHEQAALSHCKTAELVQHIVPIRPAGSGADDGDEKEVEPTLYLTKRELKRQRKLRRQEKQREIQDLQSAGVIPPPEPRLTLQNFIRVLGDQAYLDPSQMEQKVMEQIQARQRAHLERNENNKLSKEQRAAKLAKKLHEDTQKTGIHVALFYVKDMSHPYHRAKVDLNAQQYSITGGVLECQRPPLACVICEGGPKAIKKYTRLMTVRMKWTGPDNYLLEEEEEEEENNVGEGMDDDDNLMDEDGEGKPPAVKLHKFNKENTCSLVWQGMASKRFFKGFVFQSCETSDQASKVLRAKGVGHYWDQILTHASGRGAIDKVLFKFKDDDDNEDHDRTVDDDIDNDENNNNKNDQEQAMDVSS